MLSYLNFKQECEINKIDKKINQMNPSGSVCEWPLASNPIIITLTIIVGYKVITAHKNHGI